jgi:hypothetical protein
MMPTEKRRSGQRRISTLGRDRTVGESPEASFSEIPRERTPERTVGGSAARVNGSECRLLAGTKVVPR